MRKASGGRKRYSSGHSPATLLAAVIVITVVGCGDHDDEPHPNDVHQCQSGYNSDWGDVPGLTLSHWDPSLCPLPWSQGELVVVGGTVTEQGATHPQGGKANSLTLRAWNSWFPPSQAGSGIHADVKEFFEFSEPSGGEWMAQVSLGYNFGTNPDWLVFEVDGLEISGSPRAWVELHTGGPE